MNQDSNKLNTVFVVIFVILFLVLCGEGYFILTNHTNATNKVTNNDLSQKMIPTPTTAQTPFIKAEILAKLKDVSYTRVSDGKVYPFSFEVVSPTGGDSPWILYSEAELQKTNFFEKKGGSNVIITKFDIKPGDTIETNEEYDPSKGYDDPTRVIKLDIIKL